MMLKIKKVLPLFLLTTLLFSCDVNNSGSSTNETSDTNATSETSTNATSSANSTLVISENEPFISELFIGEKYTLSCIEIGNSTNASISLSNYTLAIFKYSDLSIEYKFSDSLNANGTIILANKALAASNSNYIDLGANYITGSNYIELRKNGVCIDAIGNKGLNTFYQTNGSMIRFKEYFKSYNKYDPLHFFHVRGGVSKYLGNLDVLMSVAEYEKGPTLSSYYSDKVYGSSSVVPQGGYLKATIKSLGDGDTTRFYFPDGDSSVNSLSAVRYLFINCPEILHPGVEGSRDQPWGQPAKTFNNNKLSNATSILVQSNSGYSLTETYDRMLGYVWYSDVSNPSLSDYHLLNYEMVLNGYANVSIDSKYDTMYGVGDVLYYDYVMYAYYKAFNAHIGVWGETDPTYDYSNSIYIG